MFWIDEPIYRIVTRGPAPSFYSAYLTTGARVDYLVAATSAKEAMEVVVSGPMPADWEVVDSYLHDHAFIFADTKILLSDGSLSSTGQLAEAEGTDLEGVSL